MPEGFRDQTKRDPNNFSREEAGQAKRAKTDPKQLKAMFRRCWEQSDSRTAFAAALWEEGFILARGDRRGFVGVDAKGEVWSLSRCCGVKPKEPRARLGSEDRLWSVEHAKAAFRDLAAQGKQRQPKGPDPEFEKRLAALVGRQRKERRSLQAKQDARQIADRKARQARLPTGLKAAWARLTGQYQRLVSELEQGVQAAHRRDRDEVQRLIERHLAERRALTQEFEQPDFLTELGACFDASTRPDPRQKLILPADDIPFTTDQLTDQPDLILDHISHKKARFNRSDVLRELAKRIRDPMALKSAADSAMASDKLLDFDDDSGDVTTKDYVFAEKTLESMAAKLAKGSGFAVDANHIKGAIRIQDAEMRKRFGGCLSDEQRHALHHILGDRQLASVVGLAGAGKSTMLKTAHAAWTQQGITVHGAALAGKAAEGLQSASGITSRTLASLEASWENGNEPIGSGDVLVIDEAGMIGTRQMMCVASKLHSIGAKLVLVGDPDQLQPIEAGRPFRHLIETHDAAQLTEIHRQREDWQKQASRDLAEGRIRDAITSYDARGHVAQRWNRDTALAALVEDYSLKVYVNDEDRPSWYDRSGPSPQSTPQRRMRGPKR